MNQEAGRGAYRDVARLARRRRGLEQEPAVLEQEDELGQVDRAIVVERAQRRAQTLAEHVIDLGPRRMDAVDVVGGGHLVASPWRPGATIAADPWATMLP